MIICAHSGSTSEEKCLPMISSLSKPVKPVIRLLIKVIFPLRSVVSNPTPDSSTRFLYLISIWRVSFCATFLKRRLLNTWNRVIRISVNEQIKIISEVVKLARFLCWFSASKRFVFWRECCFRFIKEGYNIFDTHWLDPVPAYRLLFVQQEWQSMHSRPR